MKQLMDASKCRSRMVADTKWLDLYTTLIVPVEGTDEDLEELVATIFENSGMLPKSNGCHSSTKLHNLVSAIRQQYNPNHYHCFLHACHVLVNCAKILGDIVAEHPLLPKVEGLAVLFAALIHDVGHLGVSNATLSHENHKLAIIYSDQSIAEMHSLACAFQLLNYPDNDILCHLSKSERKVFRCLVIDLVLGTNVMDHERQQLLQRNLENTSKSAFKIDLEIQTNRRAVFNLVMRAADVGAQMQNIETSRIWSKRFFLEQREARNAGRMPHTDGREFCFQHSRFVERHAAVLADALALTGNLSSLLSLEILESTHKNLNVWGIEGPSLVEAWCNLPP